MTNTLIFYLRLIRIKQWVKNTFIFFPLIFSGQLFLSNFLYHATLTFIGFCLISSSMYILNDLLDLKKDRVHPKKAKRPLAQGKVNIPLIFFLILALQFMGLSICLRVDFTVFLTAVFYVLTILLYNFGTKRIVLLDVISIAAGFHFRIWAGAFAVGVIPSVWLQMCVFLLALFLGFTKRRRELSTLKNRAPEHRSVLAHYTSYLLDQIIIICSTLAIVFYGLYTISSDIADRIGSNNMVYSLVFVIYGIFRYLYLIHVRNAGDDPGEVLFSDLPLLTCVILWIAYIGMVLYTPMFR